MSKVQYFYNCKDLNDAKSLFRKLCKELHPDHNNGNDQEFIKMHAEFKQAANRLKFSTGHEEDKNFNADKFYNMVAKFDSLEDIKINFIGSFIWLEDLKHGAMYQQKEVIKSIIFEGYNFARWANQKKSWYYSPQDYAQKGSAKKSIEELKSTYTSATFKTKQTARLSA